MNGRTLTARALQTAWASCLAVTLAACAATPKQSTGALSAALVAPAELSAGEGTEDLDRLRARLGDSPLLASGSDYIYVGSADGGLVAYLRTKPQPALRRVGRIETGEGVQSIAVGPDGLTIFVGRPFSVEAYAFEPERAVFFLIDEATTTGEGTRLVTDPEGRYLLVTHGPEHAVSFLKFSDDEGFGRAERADLGVAAREVCINAHSVRTYVPCVESERMAHYIWEPAQGRGALRVKLDPKVARR